MNTDIWGIIVGCGIIVIMFTTALFFSFRALERANETIRQLANVSHSINLLLKRCDRMDHVSERVDNSITDIYNGLNDHNFRLRYLESAGDKEDDLR